MLPYFLPFKFNKYPIYRPIRHIFFPEKYDLNSTCILCAKGKHYFQTYRYPYPNRVKTTMKMILVAVTTIFWVSMMNKLCLLILVCNNPVFFQ